MNIHAFILLAFLGSSSAFLLDWFRASNWNDLKVHWGLNPLTSFKSLPRTSNDAVGDGFSKISTCEEISQFKGARYAKGNDKSIILLFDKNGIIAGIQIEVPKNKLKYTKFPLPSIFVEINGKYYITAYFVAPETICSKGRTKHQLDNDGTGDNLRIQFGKDPVKDLISIPKKESGMKNTVWTEGKCFKTMGNHYWYNISKTMDCDDVVPLFMLYNKGELNGFGWILEADLPALEHPPQSLYPKFMADKDIPQCLYNKGTLSTLHIFLSSTPLLNFC